MKKKHFETHQVSRVGWLRAAVLGANDGIISTASLLMGMASADSSFQSIVIAGIAGLVAGALSMAAGEYISVSSQADAEQAAITKEKHEIETKFPEELIELTNIYIKRGLTPKLASQVAHELMQKDALQAHTRDELGINEHTQAKPLQAALFSAFSFSLGSIFPLLVVILTPQHHIEWILSLSSILLLTLLGAISAHLGGASIIKAITRVVGWGSLALLISTAVGLVIDGNL
jgi:VIT1/CCC1 family predicted Fe2+/Mn2+ transporter